jgi:hypothetical protein
MMDKRIMLPLLVVILLLAGLACSGIPMFSKYNGVAGESRDANHDQWSNLLEPGQENANPPETGSDSIEGEARSEGGGDSNQPGGSQDDNQLDPSLDQTILGKHIKSGDAVIELIESTGGGTQGQIIAVVIINKSGEELVLEVPPGLVFSPVDSDEQDLMVLDGEVVELEPDETIILTPYVICIESSAATPSSGSSYEIAYLADGDLLAFAQCVDEEAGANLSEDDIALQLAVWSIANQENVLEMPEGSENLGGAYAELFEELELTGMLETVYEMMAGMSEEWLRRCEVSVGGEQ